MQPASNTKLSHDQVSSYRAHAGRYGVRRIAEIMRKRGVPIEAAVAVLARRARS